MSIKSIVFTLACVGALAILATWLFQHDDHNSLNQVVQSAEPAFVISPPNWSLTEGETFPIESVESKAVVLVDANSGRILAERNSQERLSIASTTKIMTAALVLEFLDTQSLVTISDTAVANLPPESAVMGVSVGEQYTVEELLYGLLLNSDNDAAQALAESVSGSQDGFVRLMNAKARQLGLDDTNFANPSGLDHPDHYSTARDLAELTYYAQQFPEFRTIVMTVSKTLPYSTNHKYLELTNFNAMIGSYPGATGVKPGNTTLAGNCLVASAERDGRRLIGVLLDTPGRNTNMARLFDLGFDSQGL